jgi:hypothetical protein
MRGIRTALSLLLVVAIVGCATGSTLESYRPKNTEETAIVSALLKIPYGVKTKALDILLLPYAGDVFVGNFNKYVGAVGGSAPLTVSKAELRSLYAELFRNSKTLSMDVKDFRLNVMGERAVVLATTELMLTSEGGKREEKERLLVNEVTWRLRRTAAGWKIVEEIWN